MDSALYGSSQIMVSSVIGSLVGTHSIGAREEALVHIQKQPVEEIHSKSLKAKMEMTKVYGV